MLKGQQGHAGACVSVQRQRGVVAAPQHSGGREGGGKKTCVRVGGARQKSIFLTAFLADMGLFLFNLPCLL